MTVAQRFRALKRDDPQLVKFIYKRARSRAFKQAVVRWSERNGTVPEPDFERYLDDQSAEADSPDFEIDDPGF